MDISVEITLSPLTDAFEPPIIDFIKRLRASGFRVLENPLSTQVYGPYDAVMQMLTQEIKSSFNELDHALVTLKIVTSNRSEYEPDY